VTVSATPASDDREQAWRELNQHLDLMASQVTGPIEELEQFADELCDRVRHGS
jgi:hypothetical protein